MRISPSAISSPPPVLADVEETDGTGAGAQLSLKKLLYNLVFTKLVFLLKLATLFLNVEVRAR